MGAGTSAEEFFLKSINVESIFELYLNLSKEQIICSFIV